ncbi:MAG: hypothetical protein K2X82_14605 [Gemmataceae bacterium]|nr:hypothetical protein [Gemmataceae bacterium]
MAPLFIAGLLLPAAVPTDPPKKGEVKLTLTSDDEPHRMGSPVGWPVVVTVNMTNVGKEPIAWLFGDYPGAGYFAVQVRHGGQDEWRDVAATNGQQVQGSGAGGRLEPGKSVSVPLAVPMEAKPKGWVEVRVRPVIWNASGPATIEVGITDHPPVVDAHRARVIAEVVRPTAPFWTHLAQTYADEVVTDAVVKLATVDNPLIASRAAYVLWLRPELPAAAGGDLAAAVRRWFRRDERPESGGLRRYIVFAALKTRSEVARKMVIDLVKDFPPGSADDVRARHLLIDALRQSPGDPEWLLRATAAIGALTERWPGDDDVARQVKWGIDWLDARIKNPRH